ncbi:hypothetical protein J7U46_11580 [Pelomonas sp. V22]|uniref:S41 family peptidase n=1 Tax=Pelomonas sp. V22 TaxID=2822139 RepID=UPI0024A8E75D|nr:S41 family peptidase [Pelomonas sp. V22]MDI4633692.1 hypothetical protein [Pelomonas sp. V22]
MTSPFPFLIRHAQRWASAGLACLLLQTDSASEVRAEPLSADQAAREVRILTKALNSLHPALTKYRSQVEISAAFARFEQRGQAARSAAEMYLAATELAAAIRCGHTWTNVLNQAGAAKTGLLEPANKLPLLLGLVEGRWLVLASADPAVAAGDEVLAVDGVGAAQMVERLMPYLRADGSSDGKRLRQLSHDRNDYSQLDMLWPLLSPPQEGRYRVELRRASGERLTLALQAVSLSEREAALSARGRLTPPSEAWTFKVDGDVATLTMPSWSVWNSKFDWAAFIDESFARLKREQVPHLVIDIRANEGGDGAVGNRLLSHLIREPLSYQRLQNVSSYERVPYALARYLDTWDYSFFDRTGDVEPITVGTAAGKFRLKSKASSPGLITPVATPYAGQAFVLVGAENSSATFVFADFVQRAHAATLVGQPTGGNQRGLNGGQLAWVVLPHSGVAVDIPLLAAAYTEATPDASVTPELLVQPSFAAAAAGRDLEMEAVVARIAQRRK